MKAVFLITMLITLNCQIQFLELEEPFIDTREDDDIIPILMEDCMDNPVFTPSNKSCDPNEYKPGMNLLISVKGTMSKEQKIKSLYVENLINNSTMSNNTIDYMGQLVPAGKYSYTYNVTLGSVSIAGLQQYYLYLINSNDERISCTKVYFEVN